MLFRQIADPKLAQYAYLVGCQRTNEALVVDPERDVDRYLALAAEEGLRVTAVAETHIHADFLSGARNLADAAGAHLYLSREGEDAGWGSRWAEGRADVTLLRDGDVFRVGAVELRALHVPGHTPEHLAYLVTDAGGGADAPLLLVSGDFVFVGDLGRPDLLESAAGEVGQREPGARALFASARRVLDLPEWVQVWPGHGAGSACGKSLGAVPASTVGYERRFNAMLAAAQGGEDAFVEAILSGQPEPPLYFARMKRLNRDGVPPLPALPTPRALAPGELALLPDAAAVVDTRPDRSAFMRCHLPGALLAPFDRQFNTTVGSYVTDPETPITLVIGEADVETAVRDLVRVGLDRVVSYATPEAFAEYVQRGGATATIPEVDFAAVAARGSRAVVLDVRRQAEFDAGHVPGALHVAHTRLAAHLDAVPYDRTVFVHCQSGVRSAVACALLARAGCDVRYVNDRFPRWAELGPVATGEDAPAAEAAPSPLR